MNYDRFEIRGKQSSKEVIRSCFDFIDKKFDTYPLIGEKVAIVCHTSHPDHIEYRGVIFVGAVSHKVADHYSTMLKNLQYDELKAVIKMGDVNE